MLTVSGVVVFALSWWVAFFMLLPVGVKTVATPEVGHAPSAPEKPNIGRKMFAATLVAACLTALAVVAVNERWDAVGGMAGGDVMVRIPSAVIVVAFIVVAASAQARVTIRGGAGDVWQSRIQPYCPSTAILHEPRDDVTYQPGTGNDGWSVTSPHLYGEPYQVELRDIRIPARIPLRDYIDDPENYRVPLDEMFIDVGTISVDDHQVYMNGEPLNRDSEALRILCEMAQE
jgi:predicted secreted protein